MDKIDKIRQEIKRRHDYENEMYHKKKPDGRPNDGWAESLAIIGVLEELLTFLDTLSEQPEPTIMTNEMLMGEIKPKQKSNALFDECVKNCDPAIMKEVSDNIDKMPKEKSNLETLREIMGKLTDDEKTTITTMLMMGGWGFGGFGGFLPLLSSMIISNAMNAQPNKEEKE